MALRPGNTAWRCGAQGDESAGSCGCPTHPALSALAPRRRVGGDWWGSASGHSNSICAHRIWLSASTDSDFGTSVAGLLRTSTLRDGSSTSDNSPQARGTSVPSGSDRAMVESFQRSVAPKEVRGNPADYRSQTRPSRIGARTAAAATSIRWCSTAPITKGPRPDADVLPEPRRSVIHAP